MAYDKLREAYFDLMGSNFYNREENWGNFFDIAERVVPKTGRLRETYRLARKGNQENLLFFLCKVRGFLGLEKWDENETLLWKSILSGGEDLLPEGIQAPSLLRALRETSDDWYKGSGFNF
jgi:hypothetical protein